MLTTPTAHDESPINTYALIAAQLHALNAEHWNTVLFAWLARYDGMLARLYLEGEIDHPATEVYQCLMQFTADTVDDQTLALALSRLDFLHYRVKHPDSGERWNPLAVSLQEFLGQETHPVCWPWWDDTWPPEADIALWLLAQLDNSHL